MKNLMRLPRWGILSLIFMTIVLSLLILTKIWFPNLIDTDLFAKVFMTYFVLIVSASVISRMSEYLKKMIDDKTDEKDDK